MTCKCVCLCTHDWVDIMFPLGLQLFTNRTACQALGNMCVLNMHSSSTITNDACGLYITIYRATAAQGNNQGNPYWYTHTNTLHDFIMWN